MCKKLDISVRSIIRLLAIIQVCIADTRPFLNTFATNERAPFIVYVRTEIKDNFGGEEVSKTIECTGSILEKNYILTLASCVPREKNGNMPIINVYAGLDSIESLEELQEEAQTRKITQVIHHPNYQSKKMAEPDLALIKVEKPFEASEYVSPLILDDETWPMVDQRPDNQRVCEVFGFGDISYNAPDRRLKVHTVKALHEDSCACAKRNQWMALVCLDQIEDVGLCNTDNGAPLVCNGKGVAINQVLVSKANCSGVPYPENICGDYNVVSFFLYLCPFLSWIKITVKSVPDQPKYCSQSSPLYTPNFLFSIFIIMINILL